MPLYEPQIAHVQKNIIYRVHNHIALAEKAEHSYFNLKAGYNEVIILTLLISMLDDYCYLFSN